MVLEMAGIAAQAISATLALLAAYKWWCSARVELPAYIELDAYESGSQVMIETRPLTYLAGRLSDQSALSAKAAQFAAGAAVFQGIGIIVAIIGAL